MKLLKNHINSHDGTGEVTLLPEQEEDMWEAYNLIQIGDAIRATTMRKVVREGQTGSVTSQKVTLTLCIQVLDVEFDTEACSLRVKGRNIEENKHVKRGQHHTIDMELNRKFTLIKPEWDSLAIERLRTMTDETQRADVAAIVLNTGQATVCLLGTNLTLVRQRIEVSIPKKRVMNESQRQKAVDKLYHQIIEAIHRHIRFDVVKLVIVASPGFHREEFLAYTKSYLTRHDDAVLRDNMHKFLAVHTSTGDLGGLKEALASPAIANQMANTKAVSEVAALDRFHKMLAEDENRAVYGWAHVAAACDALAIDTLLLSDTLLRSRDVGVRKQYVNLVETVKDQGGTVRIFSSMHVSGQQLDNITGVAAVLRFPMPNLFQDDVEDQDDDDNEDFFK
ncbi:uncharacterized protein MONBRDRAFT_13325 [Monosiga brevicollis MX1]|uniref:Protein pelota homolog n=1 Tax=Monosiga brevicollis TaxID=81824 RepID=A9UQJ9_MONBE|nr:uncharacterized protein MONBRDRAFT_13325 [Monosiga brevicollis MX1]EDQ93058.1 predicted protein [Monosiga brevicollis MX1]|eukprot:XP_001742820.1 hypothetical protein [Monosiga brevicollis MX1]